MGAKPTQLGSCSGLRRNRASVKSDRGGSQIYKREWGHYSVKTPLNFQPLNFQLLIGEGKYIVYGIKHTAVIILTK